MNFNDLIPWVLGGLTPEEAKVMRNAGVKLAYRLWITGFSLGAMGYLVVFGIPGFATTAIVESKIAPLSAAVGTLTVAVQSSAAASKSQAVQALRSAIIDTRVKQCRAKRTETAEVYRLMLIDTENQYENLTQQTYPLPACADL